jgi:nitrate reductase NapE component
MVSLVRSYAEGRTDDEAFLAATGMDVGAFNDAWLADLGAAAPTRYGPQPAPAGPLPEGWNGATSPSPVAGTTPVPDVAATPRPTQATAETSFAFVVLPPFLLPLLAIAVIGAVALLVWSRARAERIRP